MAYIDDNLMPGEQVVYRTHLHWIVFLRPSVILMLFLVMLVVSSSGAPSTVGGVMGIVVTVLFLWFLVEGPVSLATYLTSEVGVTSKRVVLKVGWIRCKTEETELEKVESIGVDQGVIGRILGYGTVLVTGTGGSKAPFRRISHALEFRKQVYQQIKGKPIRPSLGA
jgi:uncharacterized membrane protein YdbT with pleckstrin-like domain